MNNDLKKVVSKSIDKRDRDTLQIVEMTSLQADSLKHWPKKNKYIYIPDKTLPLIADDLTSLSTTQEIADKINAIIVALDGWVLRRG